MHECPDNLDIFDAYETEQERMHRHNKKLELEDDLPWLQPCDYGEHENCYYGGKIDER